MVEHNRDGEEQPGEPRCIFFGMECQFSLPVLRGLVASGIQICAVVIPADASVHDTRAIVPLPAPSRPASPKSASSRLARLLPMVGGSEPESIVAFAWQHDIPVWRVRTLAARETVATLSVYEPDLICVACFSAIIPRVLLDLPRLGCVNVHPSLLPALRGPLPLFWTFREGHDVTGTTVHFMTPKLDSGAILAQETIIVPDGIRYAELEEQCAQLGGRLLARVVVDLYQDRAQPFVQDENQQSYRSYPQADDYTIVPGEWSARYIYNFVRGIAPDFGSVAVLDNEWQLFVRDAIEFGMGEPSDGVGAQNDPKMTHIVRCRDGWVRLSGVEYYRVDAR